MCRLDLTRRHVQDVGQALPEIGWRERISQSGLGEVAEGDRCKPGPQARNTLVMSTLAYENTALLPPSQAHPTLGRAFVPVDAPEHRTGEV